MNDFTRKELLEICCSLKATAFTPYLTTMFKPDSIALIDKIQSLINNYCEHEKFYYKELYIPICAKCRGYVRGLEDNE
jgi:hypothetical protein